MNIVKKKGYAIEQDVDIVVNSANGFLLFGSSGAGEIRNKSQRLNFLEKIKYNLLLDKLHPNIKKWYKSTYSKHNWKPSYAQLKALEILIEKEKQEFRRGTAVIQENWSKKDKRILIHTIAMSYDITHKKTKRKKATSYLIEKAIKKTLQLAEERKIRSIAIPVLATRPKYGIGAEKSKKILLNILKEHKGKHLKKVIVCFDNNTSKRYLDK